MAELLQSPGSTRASGRLRWGPSLLLAGLVLALVAPLMHPLGEQQASRYALTASLWERRSVVIDDFSHLLGRDRAVRDGVTYSDKAPGQPFLAVPFYGAYRLVGGEPMGGGIGSTDLGLWWLTLWTAGLPAAVLASLMYGWARQIGSGRAMSSALTLALGTMLLVYATLLFGHVLAALLGFSMFLLVRGPEASRNRLLAAGLVGGLAVLVEYPMALVIAVVGVGSLVLHRRRSLWVVVGGAPAAVLLGVYNLRVAGSPFSFPYQWSAFSGPVEQEREVLGIFSGPALERLAHVLVSHRGLIIATPVIAVALVGVALLWRRGNRAEALIAGGAFLVLLAVQASWGNSYAGGAGPRYLAPALPFLAAPLAVAWARWRRTSLTLAGVSVVTMMAATFTIPQLGSHFEAGLGFWLRRAMVGDLAPNIYTSWFGGWGWLVYAGSVALMATLLGRAVFEERVAPGSGPVPIRGGNG